MPPFGPVKRRDRVQYLKAAGFEGPYNHQFMRKGDITLRIPNPHPGDIGQELLARTLRQTGISKAEWEVL